MSQESINFLNANIQVEQHFQFYNMTAAIINETRAATLARLKESLKDAAYTEVEVPEEAEEDAPAEENS